MTLLNEADAIYLGGAAADRVYLGANLVWQPPVASIAAPVFRNKTNRNYPGGSGIIHVSKPAGTIENDILFVLTVTGKAAPPMNELVPGTPFNRVGTSMVVQDISSFSARLELFWRRMTASEPASYEFDVWTSNNNEYYAASYSGCPTSGSPIDTFSQASGTYPLAFGNIATAPGVTTTQANDKMLWFGHNWDASGTLVPPSEDGAAEFMTERHEYLLYASDQTIATARTTSFFTQTQATTNPWGVYLVALKGM